LLRAIREIANAVLSELSGDFAAMYAPLGRPSIPPEKLLRASLLQAFYTIRSERQLMERLEFDLLYRWFVGLSHSSASVRPHRDLGTNSPCNPGWKTIAAAYYAKR
jgi:transposase